MEGRGGSGDTRWGGDGRWGADLQLSQHGADSWALAPQGHTVWLPFSMQRYGSDSCGNNGKSCSSLRSPASRTLRKLSFLFPPAPEW